MNIKELKQNPNNPRIIKDDKFNKLVKSIKDFPQMMEKRPIVVVTDVDGKMYPLGGNMRLKALTHLGYKEIPDNWVIKADDWTIEQRKEFIIKDNVGFGEWDWEMLANDWDSEKIEEWGLEVPVFGDSSEDGNFDDEGISEKNQYGVIVICESAGTQESVFNDLTGMGFNCKIVVT